MNRYQCDYIFIDFIRDHYQYPVVMSYHNPTPCFRIKVSLYRMLHNLLNSDKVKST